MHIIVIGAGVTGIACTHNFLKHGHNVTLIEKASTPNQECSFGMAGFMGPINTQMLCAPFKGKAGLASIFAKTRRLGWDVSLSQMKFLRALASARSADVWAANHDSLLALSRYSVGLTEFTARLDEISFEQCYGLLRVYTNGQAWEDAHKDEAKRPGEWLSKEESMRVDPSLENLPDPFFGSSFLPQELSGNGNYYSKQIQALNVAYKNLTLMYHTEVTGIIKEGEEAVKGVSTDKGDIFADAVVVSCNLGAKPLLDGLFDLPLMALTGWTITAKIDPMNVPPSHTLVFDNKDLLVTRLGNRVRVCGRYWLGESSQDMTDKVIEELFETACKLLPTAAVWKDSTNWVGKTLTHPDSLPSCGVTPYKGLYLNIAHGLNGWALSEGCAELLHDLISEKTPSIDPTPYSPMRFIKKR